MKTLSGLHLRTLFLQASQFLGCMLLALFLFNQWMGIVLAAVLVGLGLTFWGLPTGLAVGLGLVALVYSAWVKLVLVPRLELDRRTTGLHWVVNAVVFGFLAMGGALIGREDPWLAGLVVLATGIVPLYQLQKDLEWTRLLNDRGGW